MNILNTLSQLMPEVSLTTLESMLNESYGSDTNSFELRQDGVLIADVVIRSAATRLEWVDTVKRIGRNDIRTNGRVAVNLGRVESSGIRLIDC